MGRRARQRRATTPTSVAVPGDRTERRIRWAAVALLVVASVTVVAVLVAPGGGDEEAAGAGGPGLAHVHGLGVNPGDGSIYIATHTGLFRAAPGQRQPTRFGESEQDVMGFSVVGPGRFLGSGHPGQLQGGPSNLGLIRSDDAGRNWEPVSLLGESDFHVLRSRGAMVYGFDASNGRFLVSADGGREWQERDVPGPMVDLAIDPADPSRIVASTEQGLATSADRGRSWRALQAGPLALLAWPRPDLLYRVDGAGRVAHSSDRGRSWRAVGSIAAQPAAFASGGGDLYVALPDATVKRSTDGGRSWSIRATP